MNQREGGQCRASFHPAFFSVRKVFFSLFTRKAGLKVGQGELPEDELADQLRRKTLRRGVEWLESPGNSGKPLPRIVAEGIKFAMNSKTVRPPDFDPAELGDFATAARTILAGNVQVVTNAIEHQRPRASE